MEINAEKVKELREQSGAGIMDCKRALRETGGDLREAVDYLRKQGIVKAGKKAGRSAEEGLIGLSVSEDGSGASLVEVNCETDFVART
ncbi:MAG: translation elongation factor Ts, partial [Deltaproteobacteria bacterium]|nr:translation elongation factor Ts [Deltaproteobacteria bacterium]